MTAQIDDTFHFEERTYAISAIEDPELFSKYFDIESFGLKPMPPSTACWRGYVANFTIVDDTLVLDALETNNSNDRNQLIPEINGKAPEINIPERLTGDYQDYRDLYYSDICLTIPYTGAILVTDGFIMDYYIHQGFQSPFAHEKVIELVFRDGKFITKNDLSEAAAKKREEIKPGDEDADKWVDILKWIDDRYDLSYSKRWD